jgi:hypothetical protein
MTVALDSDKRWFLAQGWSSALGHRLFAANRLNMRLERKR